MSIKGIELVKTRIYQMSIKGIELDENISNVYKGHRVG